MTSRRWTSGRVPVEFSERMPTLTPDTSVRAAGRAVGSRSAREADLRRSPRRAEHRSAAQGGQAVPGPRRAFAFRSAAARVRDRSTFRLGLERSRQHRADRRVCRGVRVDRCWRKGVVLYPRARLTKWQLCGLVQRPSETGAVSACIGRCWSGDKANPGPSTTRSSSDGKSCRNSAP